MQSKIDAMKKSASGKQARIKELDELLRMADYYKAGKPVADKLKTIRFEKSRQKYKAEHGDPLHIFAKFSLVLFYAFYCLLESLNFALCVVFIPCKLVYIGALFEVVATNKNVFVHISKVHF